MSAGLRPAVKPSELGNSVILNKVDEVLFGESRMARGGICPEPKSTKIKKVQQAQEERVRLERQKEQREASPWYDQIVENKGVLIYLLDGETVWTVRRDSVVSHRGGKCFVQTVYNGVVSLSNGKTAAPEEISPWKARRV